MHHDVDSAIRAIRKGPRGRAIGAFFDFDGTLIDGYSAAALYGHRIRNLEVGPAEIISTLRLTRGDTPTEEQFAQLMRTGIAGWAGRLEEDLVELGQRLFNTEIAGKLFHEAFRLVKAHQAMGHTVVIATSATRLQVAPMAAELGVEHILCTELAVEDGLITGEVAGRPPWAAGKQAAVSDFARRHRINLANSYGYANGDEDVAFLASVGRPTAVNAQPRLRVVSAERSWPQLTFRAGPGRLDPVPLLRTVALYGGLMGACLTGIGVSRLTGNGRRGKDFASDAFGVIAGPIGDVQVEVTGQENAWAARPAVFLINHQSALIDLIVVTKVLRTGVTAVAKKEVASIPSSGRCSPGSTSPTSIAGRTRPAVDWNPPSSACERACRSSSPLRAPDRSPPRWGPSARAPSTSRGRPASRSCRSSSAMPGS